MNLNPGIFWYGCLTGVLVALASATSSTASAREATIRAFSDCPDCPKLVELAGGSFVMGSTKKVYALFGEPAPRVAPVRRIEVRPFAIGVTEVTLEQFAVFARETGYEPSSPRECRIFESPVNEWTWWNIPDKVDAKQPSLPVRCVSWLDAKAYVEWLARKTGKAYRLPSEAEWEYAARAGATSDFPWGDNPADGCRYVNGYDHSLFLAGPEHIGARSITLGNGTLYDCNDGFADLAPAASLQPNKFGIYDMGGNLWEWGEDCYLPNPTATDSRAVEVEDCKMRVLRGGSWRVGVAFSYPFYRGMVVPTERSHAFGIRVARDP
ncbi:MAG: SUMF1/EgtB/PvdO family nonheme iron enzyme [Steroidobacteraceae bacterium]